MTAMTTPALMELCEGLAANLEPLGIKVSAGFADMPVAPCAEVLPGPEEYHQAFQNGRHEARFVVRVYVATAAPTLGQQQQLFEYLAPFGERSVKRLLEEGDGLDDLARAMKVESRTGPQAYERPGQPPLIGAQWNVVVWPNVTRKIDTGGSDEEGS